MFPTIADVTCDGLKSPANGLVFPADMAQLYNTTAYYSCKAGWQINEGNNSRTCENDGTWSGEAPNCTREYVVWKILDPPLFFITDGCTNLKRGHQPIIWPNCSRNCMKTKKIWTKMGARLSRPLMNLPIENVYCEQYDHPSIKCLHQLWYLNIYPVSKTKSTLYNCRSRVWWIKLPKKWLRFSSDRGATVQHL